MNNSHTIYNDINDSVTFSDPNEQMTFIHSTQVLAMSAGPSQTLILANDSWMTVEDSAAYPLRVVITGNDFNVTMADFYRNMDFLLHDQGHYTLSTQPRGGILIATAKSQIYVMGTSIADLSQHIHSV